MDGIATNSDQAEIERYFMSGGLRQSLGLDTSDLKLGLTVARNQLMRGATTDAMRTYMTLVLCEPTNVEFQVGLANCAHQLGEYSLALQAASAIIALDPKNPRGYYFSGRACLALNHYAEAQEDLTDAVTFGKQARDAQIVQEADLLLKKLAALRV